MEKHFSKRGYGGSKKKVELMNKKNPKKVVKIIDNVSDNESSSSSSDSDSEYEELIIDQSNVNPNQELANQVIEILNKQKKTKKGKKKEVTEIKVMSGEGKEEKKDNKKPKRRKKVVNKFYINNRIPEVKKVEKVVKEEEKKEDVKTRFYTPNYYQGQNILRAARNKILQF